MTTTYDDAHAVLHYGVEVEQRNYIIEGSIGALVLSIGLNF